jgi:NAD(P)-dependent dehydrogenase (short-subunit alcohol dehydrogenase family)
MACDLFLCERVAVITGSTRAVGDGIVRKFRRRACGENRNHHEIQKPPTPQVVCPGASRQAVD